MKVSYPKLHSYTPKRGPNVVDFTGDTRLPTDPKRVIIGALNMPLKSSLLLAQLEDGTMYYAGSAALAGHSLWLIEQFKKDVI